MPKIPIPDDWDGESWQCYVIEWPDSERWRAIFLGQVTAPGKGRFWDERTGTITSAQETGLEIYRRNILGGIMSCFDDLALSVRYLADRLYDRPCCPDAVNLNVVQTVTAGGNTIYGTQEPGGLTGEAGVGDPPTGYSTWAEYYSKKCQAANLVADGIISLYNNLGAISIGSAAVVAAAVGLSIPGIIAVPPAVIPLLVAALLGLGVSISVLTSVGGWLSDNRDDLVCALYESDGVALAIDAFAALIDEALIALAIGSSLHPYVKAVALGMASTDTLNQLFNANLGISYAGVDCSECASPAVEYDCLRGDVVSETANTVSVSAWEAGDGMYYVGIRTPVIGNIELQDVDGWTAPTVTPDFATAKDDDGLSCGEGSQADWDQKYSTLETGPHSNVTTVLTRSSTDFTLTFVLT